MKLEVYSKDGCSHCVNLKNFLERKNIVYNEYKIGENITLETFKEKWPDVRYLPLVVSDNEKIDNYIEYLENKYAWSNTY